MITCTKCTAPLSWKVFSGPGLRSCPVCGVLTRVDVFPALFRGLSKGTPGETLVLDDQAGCFYHPKKKAVIPCSACGRFLCALCDVEFNGRHLCPSCLETGNRKGKIKDMENHRTLYDSIVLFLAIVPMLFIWPTILTAPMVFFMAVRYWKAPTSIIPRSKVRFIVALVLAGFQIIGWSVFISSIVT